MFLKILDPQDVNMFPDHLEFGIVGILYTVTFF